MKDVKFILIGLACVCFTVLIYGLTAPKGSFFLSRYATAGDKSFELYKEASLAHSRLRFYRVGCGPVCGFPTAVVRQELPLVGGFSLSRIVFSKWGAENATITDQVGSSFKLNIDCYKESKPDCEDTPPLSYKLKSFVYF